MTSGGRRVCAVRPVKPSARVCLSQLRQALKDAIMIKLMLTALVGLSLLECSYSYCEPEVRSVTLGVKRVPKRQWTDHFSFRYAVLESPSNVEASYTVFENCSLPVYRYRRSYIGKGRYRKRRYASTSKWTGLRVTKKGSLNLKTSPLFKTFYECNDLFKYQRNEPRCYVDLQIVIRVTGGYMPIDRHYPIIHYSCDIFGKRKDVYTANCSFADGDTCDYTSDGCSFSQWSINGGEKTLAGSPIESCDLVSNDILNMVALTSANVSDIPANLSASNLTASNESDLLADREARDSAEGLSLHPSGEEDLKVGTCNTPTLTAHGDYNKAMEFVYKFHAKGVHQIAILLLCMSEGSKVMPMRKDFRHYKVANFTPRRKLISDRKCLDIHTYLRGADYECTKFQVQFQGAAKGSGLVLQNVNFLKACSLYDNVGEEDDYYYDEV